MIHRIRLLLTRTGLHTTTVITTRARPSPPMVLSRRFATKPDWMVQPELEAIAATNARGGHHA